MQAVQVHTGLRARIGHHIALRAETTAFALRAVRSMSSPTPADNAYWIHHRAELWLRGAIRWLGARRFDTTGWSPEAADFLRYAQDAYQTSREFVDVREAAQILGKTERHARRLAEQGRLGRDARRSPSGKWLCRRGDVQAAKKTREDAG